ncbi:8798_t:CDS:2, partial [Acaulospora morrowiae]
SFQLSIEVRQFFHDWKKYLVSFWNLFDLCVYIFPIATAISLLKDGSAPVWALAISNFLLDIKFLLFFRVFKSFSGYFEIFFGVAKSLVSFFVVLTLIFLAYYHALYVIIEEDSENSATWNNPMIIIFFGLVGIFTITYLSSLLIRLLNEEVHHAKERESFLAYKIMLFILTSSYYTADAE